MSSRLRVARHRERLVADGLRPVHFTVVDLRQEPVRAEMRRQAAEVAQSPASVEMLGRLEQVRCLYVEPWVSACIAQKAP